VTRPSSLPPVDVMGTRPLECRSAVLRVAVFKELHLPSLPRYGNENHDRLASVVFERLVEAIALNAGKKREWTVHAFAPVPLRRDVPLRDADGPRRNRTSRCSA
jgi:hypothetical protein